MKRFYRPGYSFVKRLVSEDFCSSYFYRGGVQSQFVACYRCKKPTSVYCNLHLVVAIFGQAQPMISLIRKHLICRSQIILYWKKLPGRGFFASWLTSTPLGRISHRLLIGAECFLKRFAIPGKGPLTTGRSGNKKPRYYEGHG